MTISDNELHAQYTGTIDWLHAPANVGLQAVAAMAVLAWEARVKFEATIQQIDHLILGKQPNPKLRVRFGRARRLAFFWQQEGVPESIAAANSFDAAREATLSWLRSKGVGSLDEFDGWDPEDDTRRRSTPGQVERLSKDIAGALHNRDKFFYDYTPTQFAIAIVEKLTLREANEFARAVADALTAKSAATL